MRQTTLLITKLGNSSLVYSSKLVMIVITAVGAHAKLYITHSYNNQRFITPNTCCLSGVLVHVHRFDVGH